MKPCFPKSSKQLKEDLAQELVKHLVSKEWDHVWTEFDGLAGRREFILDLTIITDPLKFAAVCQSAECNTTNTEAAKVLSKVCQAIVQVAH